jgi:hypothetical protein
MSDTCTVEVGLLKKHPCGAPAATKCVNCEQPICAKHAAPKMADGKKVFLCPECARAWKESEKLGDIPAPAPAAAPAAAAPPAAPKPAAAVAPKPAAVAPKPAAVAPKPAAKPPAPAAETSGPLEFTPGKPAAPEKKAESAAAPTPPAPPPAPAGGKTELSIEESMPPLEFPEKKPGDKK